MGIYFSDFHISLNWKEVALSDLKLKAEMLSKTSCLFLTPSTNLTSSHGGSSNLFRKQKLLNSGFFEAKATSFTALVGPGCPWGLLARCALFPHGSPSNMWRWSWTSDLWTVFQLKYSLSVTVNPPTHSPLPFLHQLPKPSSLQRHPQFPLHQWWLLFQV